MGKLTKFFAQIVATVGVALAPVIADNQITPTEGVSVGITFVGAVLVLGATNTPSGFWLYAKGWFSALMAALVAANQFVGDGWGLDGNEWIQVGIAALGAVGVIGLRNTGSTSNGASTMATGLPATFTA